MDCVGVTLALASEFFALAGVPSPPHHQYLRPWQGGHFCVSTPSSSCEGASSSCSTYLVQEQSTENPSSRSSHALSQLMGATESRFDMTALNLVTTACGTAMSSDKYATAMLAGNILCTHNGAAKFGCCVATMIHVPFYFTKFR